ncbi:MAG: DNA mismatch repair endonuclease MutL [Deltaproteobacteria bacterium]|nr:DNA mismatch repair endonuclease MutL [Deltaproteobacteria bacterium]
MTNRIKILSPELAAKIAAGEVVDRPASVLKELMENSIDAGARSITVTLAEGGRRMIRVVDDGCGISGEDAALAFVRHATSKISVEDDLWAIRTMGFRGEALASISSVARVVLRTRRASDDAGTVVEAAGVEPPSVAADGCPAGTSVEVKDLFFNTPARLKFLRSTQAEFGRCVEVFKKIAYANPATRMKLVHGPSSNKVIDSPPGTLKERIADIAGRGIADRLVIVDTPFIKGFIATPDISHAAASNLFTYVNGRPVRDKTLTAAIIDGCGTVIERMRYPFAVLDVIVDPADVDVNIHPAKTEVRFKDQRFVYDAVKAGVAGALAAVGRSGRAVYPVGGSVGDGQYANDPSHLQRAGQGVIDNAGFVSKGQARLNPPGLDGVRPGARGGVEVEAVADTRLLELDTVGQLWGEFLIAASTLGGGEFYIIDQHGAAERCAYERLKKDWYGVERVASQALLLPERVETTPEEAAALNVALERIERLGFEVVPFGLAPKLGGETFLIKSVPDILAGRGAGSVIKDLATEFADSDGSRKLEDRIDSALMRVACHSVIRGPRPLTREEGNALLRSLAKVDFAGWCPHGRPVIKRYTRAEVEAFFKR